MCDFNQLQPMVQLAIVIMGGWIVVTFVRNVF